MTTAGPLDTIVIGDAALVSGVVHKERKFVFSPHFWHKIIVKNAEVENRDIVLRTLMETVHPHDFIPVHYVAEGEGSVSFLVKNCGDAIMEMCRLNLTVPHPDTAKNHPPFRLTVVLKEKPATAFKVDIQQNIVKILKRRYNLQTKTLDLDQFYQDSELTEFCPLSQPKLMYFVLHLGRDLEIQHLRLSNNGIEILKPFEAMCGEKCLKGLLTIDLRKNKIKHCHELSILKMFPITELNIEDNPICNGYKDHEYVKTILKYFPNVTKLDGCRVSPMGMLPFRRNFLCSQSGQDFVDRFLEHYFTLYDTPHRALLEPLYHKESVFSLTQQFLAGQTSSLKAKLLDYKKYGRNIKQISDFSKSDDMVYVGSHTIARVLKLLPATEHDPYTFTVDMTHFQPKMVVLTVTGVFKHPGKFLLDSDHLYNFMRTFILTPTGDSEYNIINEMLNVTNATTLSQVTSFKVTRVSRPSYIHIPVPKDNEGRENLIEAFSVLTNMKKDWSKKCLKESGYDLKQALNLFVSLFKADKLPFQAFKTFDDQDDIQKVPLAKPSPAKPYEEMHIERLVSQSPTMMSPILIDDDDDVLSYPAEDIQAEVKDVPSEKDKEIAKTISTINDKVILDAVSMPRGILQWEAKVILEAAAYRVITNYKDNMWYYKLVALEYYKNGLISEARSFLERIKSVLGDIQFDILSMTFLLYEIEFGNESYVDELIMKRIRAEPVEKVLILIMQEATKISLDAARSVLRRMIHYDIDLDVTKKVLSANMDFEVKNGNSTTISEVNMLRIRFLTREELANEELAKTAVSHPVVKPTTPIIPPVAKPVAAPIQKWVNPVKKPTTLPKPVIPVKKPMTLPNPVIPVKKPMALPKPVIAVKKPVTPFKKPITVAKPVTPIVEPETSSTPVVQPAEAVEFKIDKKFRSFRSMLLEPVGICPEEIDNPDVEAIVEYTGDDSGLIQLCDNILEGYENRLAIIKIVSMTYWDRQMYENLRELLANAKDFCDEKLLENLIVLYNIKTDILQGNVNKIIKKLAVHINAITTVQMLNLFVDLANEKCCEISKVFEDCLTDLTISLEKKELISLEFVDFSLKIDKDEIIKKADGYFLKFHQPFKAYHCDEELKKIEVKPPPIKFPSKNVNNDVKKYLTKEQFSFLPCTQIIRLLYENEQLEIARVYKNTCGQKLAKNKLSAFKFSLLSIMLESKYGENWRAIKWLTTMAKTGSEDMNFVCLRADCLIKNKELKNARDLLAPFIQHLNVIMNPEVQKLLFLYSNDWKVKYKVDLLPRLLKDLIPKER